MLGLVDRLDECAAVAQRLGIEQHTRGERPVLVDGADRGDGVGGRRARVELRVAEDDAVDVGEVHLRIRTGGQRDDDRITITRHLDLGSAVLREIERVRAPAAVDGEVLTPGRVAEDKGVVELRAAEGLDAREGVVPGVAIDGAPDEVNRDRGGSAAVVRGVGALTAGERVAPRPGDQGVIAGPAFDHIIARSARETVASLTARQGVVARASVDDVVPKTAFERVVALSALEGVVALSARDEIVAAVPVDPVVAGAAFDHIVAVTGRDGVVARPAVDDVVALARVDDIVAGSAANGIAAGATEDGVVPPARVDDIVPVEPAQTVRVVVAGQRVVLVRALGVLELPDRVVPARARRGAGLEVHIDPAPGDIAVGNRVRAQVAVERVIPQTAPDGVIAVPALDLVVPRVALQRVIAPASVDVLEVAERVVARGPARGARVQIDIDASAHIVVAHPVGAVAAVEGVVAEPAVDMVVARAGVDDIVAPLAVEHVVPGVTGDRVVLVRAVHILEVRKGVAAARAGRCAGDHVNVDTPAGDIVVGKRIGTLAAVHGIVARSAADIVIAGAGTNGVIAAAPLEPVVRVRPNDRVVLIGRLHILDIRERVGLIVPRRGAAREIDDHPAVRHIAVGHGVTPRPALDRVVAAPALDPVVAGSSVDDIVPPAGSDRVVPIPGENRLAGVTCHEPVVITRPVDRAIHLRDIERRHVIANGQVPGHHGRRDRPDIAARDHIDIDPIASRQAPEVAIDRDRSGPLEVIARGERAGVPADTHSPFDVVPNAERCQIAADGQIALQVRVRAVPFQGDRPGVSGDRDVAVRMRRAERPQIPSDRQRAARHDVAPDTDGLGGAPDDDMCAVPHLVIDRERPDVALHRQRRVVGQIIPDPDRPGVPRDRHIAADIVAGLERFDIATDGDRAADIDIAADGDVTDRATDTDARTVLEIIARRQRAHIPGDRDRPLDIIRDRERAQVAADRQVAAEVRIDPVARDRNRVEIARDRDASRRRLRRQQRDIPVHREIGVDPLCLDRPDIRVDGQRAVREVAPVERERPDRAPADGNAPDCRARVNRDRHQVRVAHDRADVRPNGDRPDRHRVGAQRVDGQGRVRARLAHAVDRQRAGVRVERPGDRPGAVDIQRSRGPARDEDLGAAPVRDLAARIGIEEGDLAVREGDRLDVGVLDPERTLAGLDLDRAVLEACVGTVVRREVERVGVRAPVDSDDIPRRGAVHDEGVVPGPAAQRVRAARRGDPVVPRAALDDVVVGPAVEEVIALTAPQQVVAVTAEQGVAPEFTEERVVA